MQFWKWASFVSNWAKTLTNNTLIFATRTSTRHTVLEQCICQVHVTAVSFKQTNAEDNINKQKRKLQQSITKQKTTTKKTRRKDGLQQVPYWRHTGFSQHMAHRQQDRWQALVRAATAPLPKMTKDLLEWNFLARVPIALLAQSSRVGVALSSRKAPAESSTWTALHKPQTFLGMGH